MWLGLLSGRFRRHIYEHTKEAATGKSHDASQKTSDSAQVASEMAGDAGQKAADKTGETKDAAAEKTRGMSDVASQKAQEAKEKMHESKDYEVDKCWEINTIPNIFPLLI